MKVFLSHTSHDSEEAQKIAKALQSKGISVWLDRDNVLPGEQIHEKISTAIDEADTFIPIITSDSINSQWQSLEISQAIIAQREGKKGVIPVLLDKNAQIPFFLNDIVYCDLSNKNDFDENVGNLAKAILNKPTSFTEANDRDNQKSAIIKREKKLLEIQMKHYELALIQKRMMAISTLVAALVITLVSLAGILIAAPNTDKITRLFTENIGLLITGVLIGLISSASGYFAAYLFKKNKNLRKAANG